MIEQRKQTIKNLVDTLASLGIIKPIMEETYGFMDAKNARAEFDKFNTYVRETVSISLELFYSHVSPEALANFSQFYTKVTGKPFDQKKIAKVIRPLTAQQQKTNNLLNMLAQSGFDILENVTDSSTKRLNGVEAYLYGFEQDIVEISPLWKKKNPIVSFWCHSNSHTNRDITLESMMSFSPARLDVDLKKDDKVYN